MHAYLVAGMHEWDYLVRLEVFIFVWGSVYRISTMREQQMAWWDCAFAQAPLIYRCKEYRFVCFINWHVFQIHVL